MSFHISVSCVSNINKPRHACAARVTVVAMSVCVCVCVCLSVKSHVNFGASVRPENAVMHSMGNEGQKICGVFSETTPLPKSSAPSLGWPYIRSAIFPVDSTRAHIRKFSKVRDGCSMP